jgi:hypothetical protein
MHRGLQILDDYFADASFFKPTGDGLLILLEYNSETLEEVVGRAVAQSVKLVEDFATLTDGNAMINFDVPQDLGIGLARGGATALVADGKVLDYSGRPLNLASRLMDLARPSGVVFDDNFGGQLLGSDLAARFKPEEAYVKGLAESEPMTVYCLAGRVEIPAFNKHPFVTFSQKSETPETITFKELALREIYEHPLTGVPVDTSEVDVHLAHPTVLPNGKKHSIEYTGAG